MDYYVVSQGKTTIPGIDDGDEFKDTDVRKCIALHFDVLWSSMDVPYYFTFVQSDIWLFNMTSAVWAANVRFSLNPLEIRDTCYWMSSL